MGAASSRSSSKCAAGSRSSIIDDGALQLASLIPELRAAISDVSSKSLEESRTTRFLLFDGVSRFLRSMSINSPLCLLLDDLQFSDPGSLSLFEHIARDLRDARILLIGAYRDIDARALHQLGHAISVTAHIDSCRVLELNALPLEGIEDFVTTTYGSARARWSRITCSRRQMATHSSWGRSLESWTEKKGSTN